MPKVRLLVAAAVVAALAARPAAAEINVVDSLEWIAADSDAIVRGEVTAVASRPGPGQVVWYDVTVRVDEAVKGAATGTLQVTVRDLGALAPAAWQQQHRELLLFLVHGARRADDDPAFARVGWTLRRGDGAALRLDGTAPDRAYTADFAVLDTRAAVLDATRASAASAARRSFRVDVPFDAPAFKALWGGSAVWMYLPVDAHLEQRALGWVASPDVAVRAQAVAALAFFPGPRHTALLRRLLADPGFATVTASGQAPVRRYLVRAEAHRVLTRWRRRHPVPVIEEPATP